MHKKIVFFVSLGALLLTSCSFDDAGGSKKNSRSTGKPVTEEKAMEIMDEITAKKDTLEELPYRFEYSEVDKTEDDDDIKYIYMNNLDGNRSYSWDVKQGGKAKSKGVAIQVTNETYEEVSYFQMTDYDKDGKESVSSGALTKKDNATYETEIQSMYQYLTGYSYIQSYLSSIDMVYQYNKANIDSYVAYREQDGNLSVAVAFTSAGEGSLNIIFTTTPKEGAENNDDLIKVEEVIAFENYRPVQVVTRRNYIGGSYSVDDMSMKYGKNNISLPSGWEESLYIAPTV